MEVRHLPRFHDIGWRWIAYVASGIVMAGLVLACLVEIEIKRDVACEVVSPSSLRVHTDGGQVLGVYVQPGQRVKQGEPLLALRGEAVDPFEDAHVDARVLAPENGTVSFVNVRQGQRLLADDVAVVLDTAPPNAWQVALRIPSEQSGFVHSGQTINIKLDAFPYMRFGMRRARIDSVSQTTIGDAGAVRLLAGSGTFGNAANDYLAWATLDGQTFHHGDQEFRVLPGMRGTASIVVGRQTLAAWVCAPFFHRVRG